MGNYLVSMLKETPVLSVVTVLDMLDLANMIGDRTFEYLVPLSHGGPDLPAADDSSARPASTCWSACLPKAGIALR